MADIPINDIEPIDFYTAAGGELGFDYNFPIFKEADLVVLQITDAGVVTTLSLSTHYTVAGVGLENGGAITLDVTAYPSGAPADYRFVLYRGMPVQRLTDYLTGGDFKALTVNLDLDSIIMMIQQNELELKRSLSLQKADAEDELKFEVETAAERAGKLMGFGDAGDTAKGVDPASLSLSGLDTLLGTLALNDFFIYNGTTWVNKTLAQTKTILDLKQNNYSGTVAPGVNDDSSAGYDVGSQWFDTTANNMYHCLDASVGAADWQQGDVVAGDLGSAALATLIASDTFAAASTANINAALSTKNYIDASGPKAVNVIDGAVATGSTVMPHDDTIPQKTEGDEYMTLAVTPRNTNNKLKIEVVFNFGQTVAGSHAVMSLFQDATAASLAGAVMFNVTAGNSFQMTLTHWMTAGTDSETTFKVRAGPSQAATMTFNGATAARKLGGVMSSSMTITEYPV